MDYKNYIEHYRRDAETYDYQPAFDTHAGQIERRRAEFIRHVLGKKYLRADSLVLDIGSGGGRQLVELSRAGACPIGLDLALLNLQKIKERLVEDKVKVSRLVAGDAYAIPFRNASLDVIIFSEVLEHLGKPTDAIVETVRVLKPTGILVISVPFREKIIQHLCIHCNRLTPANAHLHSFDEQAIQSLLAGLPVMVIKEVFFHSKVMNLLNLPYRLRHFPYTIWRFIDRLFNLVFRCPYYYAIILRKKI